MSSESRSTFFRQSGWMVMATTAGGVFMMLVHRVASEIGEAQYGEFFTLLRCLILLGIPTIGLQNVFAHQAAAAVTEEDKQRLTQTTRVVLFWVLVCWLLMAIGVAFAQETVVETLKLTNPASLWLTMLVVLASLWLPVFRGLLMGTQNFFGVGWMAICEGVGRFVAIAVIVLILHWKAAGAMLGACLGQVAAIGIGIWLMRDVLKGKGEHFTWGPWLRKVIPLTLGFGALLFMQNADVLYVQSTFSKEHSPFYMPAAMIGFALVQFTGPLVSVMFPKIVRSAARSEKSNVMFLTFWITAAIGAAGAIGCTFLPELPIHILYWKKPEFLQSAPIVPWFGWAMLLMMLANVLVGSLLARSQFRIVPWIVLLAIAYGYTLAKIRPGLLEMDPFAAFKRLVQVLGAFNIVMLTLALVFSWKPGPAQK